MKPVRSVSLALKRCLMAAGLAAAGATAALALATLGKLTEVTPATSPFGALTACGDIPDTGTNFPNSYVEPWLDVNPTNPMNIVAYTQTDRWSNGGSRGLVANVSTDGGAKWTAVVVPGLTLCSGGTFERASDPWVSFGPGPSPVLYQVSLSFNKTTPPGASGGFGPSALLVSKSADGGMTWSSPVTVIEDTDPRILNDKESITADPLRPSNVYVVWDRLEVPFGTVINPENVIGLGFKSPFFFSRSTDGGATFSPPRNIFDPGANSQTIGNQLLVLPNGTLVDFFNEILNFNGSSRGFNLALLRSADQGTTWLPNDGPILAAKIQSIPVTTPNTSQPVRTGNILFDVAVNPFTGTLYAVWQDARFTGVDAIAFAQSTDGGFTWSAPIKINQTPTTVPIAQQQAFNASVAVNDSGTVLVTYYDFRNDSPAAAPAELTDYFAVFCSATCTSSGSWVGNESRLTDTSFDITKAPKTGSPPTNFFLGDYEGLKADSTGTFLPVFAQPSRPLTGSPNPAALFFRTVTPPSTLSSVVSRQ